MHRWFDKINIVHRKFIHSYDPTPIDIIVKGKEETAWYNFCLYHSRFYAKKDNVQPSKLCMADKLSIALEPYWLYLPRVIVSKEINEYMKDAEKGKYISMKISIASKRAWFSSMAAYLKSYAYEHKDGKIDEWTPEVKEAFNKEGVWK